MDTWFLNLRQYFSAKEMKSQAHMNQLFIVKIDAHKDEGSQYTLVIL